MSKTVIGRQMVTREFTTTLITSAKIEVVDGSPIMTPLEDEKVVGSVTHERANRIIEKKHGRDARVLTVVPETKVYEMSVVDFMSLAKIKEDEEDVEGK